MSRYNIKTGDLSNIFWIEPGSCAVCDAERFHVLFTDNSSEEYGAYGICVSCALKAFAFAASTDFTLIVRGLAAIEQNETLTKDNAALATRNSELMQALNKALNKP